ncbi:MAG TPA: alpha/beta fold hydrolase, partial [Myxococcales bacterium]|nr:alpha/beta fold hydrolase [Myxococcales bacterium]
MKLNARVVGQGEELIVLHGLLGSARNWHHITSKFLAPHMRCHALDLRNHGTSPHSPNFDLAVMAADVIEYLDTHKIKKAHILGHSLGGKVAMQIALCAPERLQQLIVVDIAPKTYAPGHRELFD